MEAEEWWLPVAGGGRVRVSWGQSLVLQDEKSCRDGWWQRLYFILETVHLKMAEMVNFMCILTQ